MHTHGGLALQQRSYLPFPPRFPCLQVHFAQEWNELHHLQIMESLGGDQFWVDRFMAQHAAVFYYWYTTLLYPLTWCLGDPKTRCLGHPNTPTSKHCGTAVALIDSVSVVSVA